MAVFYKFKSATHYDSIPMVDSFIPLRTLKYKIFDSKKMWRGTDYDLVVTNAQTNEEYLDGESIPKNTSVVIRRMPGPPRMPIVLKPNPKVEDKVEKSETEKISLKAADPRISIYPGEKELAELWGSEIPKAAPLLSKEDEDRKIRALVETPALDWQRQDTHGFGPGKGFSRGRGGRMMARRGFDPTWFERKIPPEGYVCHRCRQPGHFIQHCPTNGDPDYDIKIVKQPYGVPKSMLRETADGSYALPSGSVAVMEPDEAAFEKAIEGIPTLCCHIVHTPPELHLESGISTAERDRLTFQVQETGSSPKIPSPSTSAATKGEQKPSLGNDKTPKLKEALDEAKPVVSPQKVIEKEMSAEVAADVSSMKHKNKSAGRSTSTNEYHHHRQRTEKERVIKKRKLSSSHHNATSDLHMASSMKVVHCQ